MNREARNTNTKLNALMKKSVLLLIAPLFVLSSMQNPKTSASKLPKQLREDFVLIPNTTYTMEPEFTTDSANVVKSISVERFFAAKTEVSNASYRQFLTDLRTQGRWEDHKTAIIDSLAWRETFSYGEPYAVHYSVHPAYDNYPVVNVAHKGALLYCTWLEDQLNANTDDLNVYKVSLPSREEWVAAAKGNHKRSPYPWGGPAATNAKGCILANFKYVGIEQVHFNVETNSYEIVQNQEVPVGRSRYIGMAGNLNGVDVTAPVSSYTPNDFGLYNMSGNVAEMVAQKGVACGGGWLSTGFDVRCVSTMTYDGPQPDVGFRPIVRIMAKR